MEISQEHIDTLQDASVYITKLREHTDELHEHIAKLHEHIDKLHEQAEQAELTIAELKTDKRVAEQFIEHQWKHIFQRDEVIQLSNEVIADKEELIEAKDRVIEETRRILKSPTVSLGKIEELLLL